tara:strand:- start:17 stop:646 length:630 start_codon:yes stop_codon:yes gene_type:complete
LTGKSSYRICKCDKKDILSIINKHHYLSNITITFKSGFNVALLNNKEVIGACVFTGFPVPELAYGCFGLNRNEQKGLWELSRFVLKPEYQKKEHNLASWFMARAIKIFKKNNYVKAILSYADNNYHSGIIYAASNFIYYGLSDVKKDFWIKQDNGLYKKHSRGKTKGIDGEWRPRSQKHRFLKIFDKKLKCKWQQIKWNKINIDYTKFT